MRPDLFKRDARSALQTTLPHCSEEMGRIMRNANGRSGLVLSRLLCCVIGLAFAAVGIGLAITARGVTEQPAGQRGAESTAADPTPVSIPAEQAAASNANGQFAIDLYRRLAETKSGENIFLSPFSISTVLTMAAEGAVDQTLDQMIDVLHVPKGGLEQIHRGQRELLRAVVPAVPPELTEKISALRTQLKETNARTEAFRKAERFKEMRASWVSAHKLAEEINALMKRVSAYELQIANALWSEQSYPVGTTFLSAVTPNYGTVVFPVNFKERPEPARRQINEWVAEQTNNRIQDLLSPGSITDQTRLVLTNTVYFRGDWAEPFDASRTHPEQFQQSNERSFDISMMQQWNGKTASYGAFTATGEHFPTPHEVRIDIKDDDPSLYPDAQGHTMLSLDYQGQKIQMVLLVPRSVTGVSGLEKFLSYESLQRWIGQLERRTVNLTIPKFKLESRYQLNDILQSLGMVRPFENPKDDRAGAQFDKLSLARRPEDRLGISQVVHQAYVDVNEVGTEAAAATSLDTVADGGPEDTPKMRPFIPLFKANRPFLFLIRDRETATILFLGRYAGPGN